MTRGSARYAALALTATLAVGCFTPEPVLYPNSKYDEVGPEVAEYDIAACMQLAVDFNANPPVRLPEGTAGDVVEDATVGAATGAAVAGAVGSSVGTGAAAGAAGGGARALVRSIFRGARQRNDDTAFQLFVERCLERKGYELVGWN